MLTEKDYPAFTTYDDLYFASPGVPDEIVKELIKTCIRKNKNSVSTALRMDLPAIPNRLSAQFPLSWEDACTKRSGAMISTGRSRSFTYSSPLLPKKRSRQCCNRFYIKADPENAGADRTCHRTDPVYPAVSEPAFSTGISVSWTGHSQWHAKS